MNAKQEMFEAGWKLLQDFCVLNHIPQPHVKQLTEQDRFYHLGTCAFYRPHTIHIMVKKCAAKGYGGRCWSWPGYAVDRTPFGVLQHELGHHVDTIRSGKISSPTTDLSGLFSKHIYDQSKEKPLTSYLGTDKQAITFYMEWFAEIFRLYVTNPGLCMQLRPNFYLAMGLAGFKPCILINWQERLEQLEATPRIIEAARKKVEAV